VLLVLVLLGPLGLVALVLREFKAQWGHQEVRQDPQALEHRDPRDRQERQDLEQRAQLELVLLAQQAQQEQQEQQVQAQQERQELVLLALQEQQAQEQQVLLELVLLAQLVFSLQQTLEILGHIQEMDQPQYLQSQEDLAHCQQHIWLQLMEFIKNQLITQLVQQHQEH
jgi:CHAT domain-containing protein